MSIETEPVGTLDEAALLRAADVARKVTEADGPLHFNATEAATLRVLMLGLQRQAADPPEDESDAEPDPQADKDALMRFWKDARDKYGIPSGGTDEQRDGHGTGRKGVRRGHAARRRRRSESD